MGKKSHYRLLQAIGVIIHDTSIFFLFGVVCRRNYFITVSYDIFRNVLKKRWVMKQKLVEEIRMFTADYQLKGNYSTVWGEPLVGFADAHDPLFVQLRKVVVSTHALPAELLADARTVIVFFLPFTRELSLTNRGEGLSSGEWATGYIETNELIAQLGRHSADVLAADGYESVTIPATHNWIEEKLVSNWSHRHIACIAGLGRFGLNNMLITEKGCSGRIGSLITSAKIEPDRRPGREFCLYKYDGSCKKCVRKCVNEALFEGSFDRFKCYEMLLKNVDAHHDLGYADVCGKCLAAVPCSHVDPVGKKRFSPTFQGRT